MDKVYLIESRNHYIAEDENGQEIGWTSRLRYYDSRVYTRKEEAQAICDSINESTRRFYRIDVNRGPCDPYNTFEIVELEVV